MSDVTVTDRGETGMIGLRGDLSAGALRAVCETVAGCGFPAAGTVSQGDGRALFWMSPDEVLVMLPHDAVTAGLAQIGAALAGTHHLAVDLSDARVVLTVEGGHAREVLAKLTPADLHPDAFGPGHFRRTRLGQIAAGIWCEAPGRFGVMCFRSVGDYALRLLRQSAADGPVGVLGA